LFQHAGFPSKALALLSNAMNLSATGLRVLVTAGAAGIGRVTAQTLLDAGARVHVCDVDEKPLPREIGFTRADVASLGDVERLFEDWERCIAVDLNGMFYCTRKAMPLIKAAGGGSIVNLSSAAGRHGFPQRSPYAAAKWGVVGFTKSLAVEAGPDKVRVNCILPGVVEGERIERVIAAKAQAAGVSHQAMRDRFLETTSLRSTVSQQDIANMVLFLCSDAGKHITGQPIAVDADVRYLV
jgi:NAD(P)-dependent dehydrogenase (short-subunit alcohol dehydrogenase family)